MQLDYANVKSLTREEFESQCMSLEEARADPTMRRTSPEELAAVERLLDVRPGVLKDLEFYASDVSDARGNKVGIYEFILSSIVEAGHSKSFILHTLLGTKHVVAKPRVLRGTDGEIITERYCYNSLIYACCMKDPEPK